MTTASIIYLPSAERFNARAFIKNLELCPPSHRLIAFCDPDAKWEMPGVVRLSRAPDDVNFGEKKPWTINNLIFFAGMKMAIEAGITHAMFLEADCRVRGNWDEEIFSEFADATTAPMFAGSCVVYNPANAGREAFNRFDDFYAVSRKRKTYLPPMMYGWKSAADDTGSCAYPNGAGTVFSIAGFRTLFTDDEIFKDQIGTAKACAPWDQELGFRLWKTYGADSYALLLHMRTMFSSYGDVQTTEDERQQLLQRGKVSLVHQIKSNWIPKQ